MTGPTVKFKGLREYFSSSSQEGYYPHILANILPLASFLLTGPSTGPIQPTRPGQGVSKEERCHRRSCYQLQRSSFIQERLQQVSTLTF